MARLDVTEVFANIRLPGHLHTESSLHFASHFEFQDTDVLLVTYPKSGTTWMQEILSLIYSNGNLQPIKTLPNWARAPWVEHTYFQEQLQHIGCPRLLTTHLPQSVLAPALKKAKPKVIYVVRNPKDVVVSYYHFQRMAKFFPDPASFEGFLHDFMAGTVHYGSWFEHVKGWLGCQEELDLFCISYEELHQDLKCCVERLSAFLDHPVHPDQAELIREHCSFAVMKENVMVNGTLVSPEVLDFQKGQFMRKGTVGDWRNHFSPEQSARFNEKYQQEMGGHPWPFRWDMD
ncbi:PREDICTED: sulfotransferase family cytosolic 2B member 1-like [Thamnophis sirtalis]|uniref:Sulfotransferase n=1 Tax=Thamnophis sirtalis TaxID=35019 RepID=A0A6I9XGW1_9SAUR|nr:PREDICTED: sulfotransferase family cytosolic 2B member 1-like [Thamnophis sirtalis]